jgi:MFS family permease
VQFAASFATTTTTPFIPLFLAQDLGQHDASSVAIWTGVVTASLGIPLMIFSPVWGTVADRYGRKLMLLRALVGSGIVASLMSAVREPWQFAVLRLLLGSVTGMVPAMTGFIASTTPRARVTWALGLLGSAVALGTAVGPFFGAILVPLSGVRSLFLYGGVVLLAAGVVAARLLIEGPRDITAGRPSVRRELRGIDPQLRLLLLALITAQAFLSMCMFSALPMAALRFLEMDRSGAAVATGWGFGLYGAASASASLLYTRPVARFGYRKTAYTAIVVLALSVCSAATSPSIELAVASMVVLGAAAGVLQPVLTSLLGLEANPRLVGTVYGLNNSALAIGLTVGPLVLGFVAAGFGASLALGASAIPLVFVALCLAFVREPTHVDVDAQSATAAVADLTGE